MMMMMMMMMMIVKAVLSQNIQAQIIMLLRKVHVSRVLICRIVLLSSSFFSFLV